MSGNLRLATCLVALSCATFAQAETVNFGRVFQATGPASLDLTGDIRAVNLGNTKQFGPLTSDQTVGGVVFRQQDNAQSVDGIVVTPNPSGIAGQALPNLGDSSDADALERIFNFGEFGDYDVAFPVENGGRYKVQVLMFEFISLFRAFDVLIDGNVAVDELAVIQNDGAHQDALAGVSTTTFTVYEATVDATSSLLTVGFRAGTLGLPHPLAAQDPANFGGATVNDGNPFVQAITVERIPEPGAAALVAVAALTWHGLRRRQA